MTATGRVELKWYWIALGAIAIYTLWPAIAFLLAMVLSFGLGCTEWPGGTPSACMVFGYDLSYPIAYMAYQFFWIIPTALNGSVLFAIWVLVLIVHHALGRSR